ncbi:hypothetical protein AQ490_25190 [Wenjunlia vitaminophila]|uniref:Bulb-type lectin domain-containing protein n=1 Tax=Wenjunlia vitaminophila TaxID=76728 RepID=A0A0T6LQV7_WENVI|nr:hypothetical protein AQ490_25190 [Wenjunlia vitaminophila]
MFPTVALATALLAVGGVLTGAAQASAAGSQAPAAVERTTADTHVYPRATLHRNQAWTSGNGRAILRVQSDGNFVLYKEGRPVWQAPGAYPNGDHAVMQEDGNFVLYDRQGRPLWASGTWRKGAYLAIQDDGNVVVYTREGRPVWATNTGD